MRISVIYFHNKIINFSVHKSVYTLFYNYPKLIFITDQKNNNIEIPIVAYFGGSSEIISYVASVGMRLNAEKAYGSYYYLGSYENQIRNAGWSSNNRIIHYFNKPVSDDNGKLFNGGFLHVDDNYGLDKSFRKYYQIS